MIKERASRLHRLSHEGDRKVLSFFNIKFKQIQLLPSSVHSFNYFENINQFVTQKTDGSHSTGRCIPHICIFNLPLSTTLNYVQGILSF